MKRLIIIGLMLLCGGCGDVLWRCEICQTEISASENQQLEKVVEHMASHVTVTVDPNAEIPILRLLTPQEIERKVNLTRSVDRSWPNADEIQNLIRANKFDEAEAAIAISIDPNGT